MNNDEKIQKITACAFIHKDGKLFVARRANTKKFLPGKYELPGGHIEFGERMEEGLKREIMEEFNVDIHVGEPFYAFTYISNGNTKHTIEVVYFAKMVDQNQNIKLCLDDHSESNWISQTEVSDFFKEDDEEGEAVKRGFEVLCGEN